MVVGKRNPRVSRAGSFWEADQSIATHMLAFEGDSKTFWYEGNYQEYEADRHKRLGAAADMPHRIKYRKLTTG